MPIRKVQYGRNHSYSINGMRTMGVTTAIGKGMPKPALVGWAAKCVAEEAVDLIRGGHSGLHTEEQVKETYNQLRKAHTRRRDNAALRGTQIHKHAQHLIRGEPVEVPLELLPFVQQCARFADEWKVAPLLTENVVGSYQWGYGGSFDLVGELPGGRRILFDYKTGASGVWAETALQLAAYRYADAYVGPGGVEIPMREVGIMECKAVWVRADGYDVIPLDTGPTVHKAFLHVLQVAKTVAVMDGWVGEPEPCPR